MGLTDPETTAQIRDAFAQQESPGAID